MPTGSLVPAQNALKRLGVLKGASGWLSESMGGVQDSLGQQLQLANIRVPHASTLLLLLLLGPSLPALLFPYPALNCLVSGLAGATETHNKASQK